MANLFPQFVPIHMYGVGEGEGCGGGRGGGGGEALLALIGTSCKTLNEMHNRRFLQLF